MTSRASTVILGDSTRKQVMDQSRVRLACVALVFVMSFMAIGARVVELSLPGEGVTRELAERGRGKPEALNLMTLINSSKQEISTILDQSSLDKGRESIVLPRGDIVDRHGLVLATSLKTASLFADAREIRDPQKTTDLLMRTLPGLKQADTLRRLKSKKSFVWLHRNLSPKEQQAVNDLGIPGLYFENEYVRVYPHGNMLAHVLGFVGVDNKGLAGIERFFDERLRNAKDGEPLTLALDVRFQHLLHAELSKAKTDFRAEGAMGVIANVKTGEVVAMANLPDFDPNHPGKGDPKAFFNRASLGTYEMGSTFKALTLAQALEYGVTGINDGYDASHPIRVANFTITDYHAKNRWLSVPEIFAYSSNIGTVKMAMEVGLKRQKAFLDEIGMMKPVTIELPERAKPQYPSDWRELSMMTISYGHGISVTPLHLVQAITSILNEGKMTRLTLVKGGAPENRHASHIVSREVSLKMRRLLRSVVQYGTGKMGDAPGYRVGGKTGTAEKPTKHGYDQSALISSFMGVFPMDDPKYLVLVMVDEPHGNKSTYGYATGGWVAAPAVSRIINRMAPMEGIEPIMEVVPDEVDAMWDKILHPEKYQQGGIVHAVSY